MHRVFQACSQLTRTPCSAESAPLSLVETETRGPVGILWLNTAKNLNVLTKQMRAEICQGLLELAGKPGVRVIILASKVEKAFCAGVDLKELNGHTKEKQLQKNILGGLEVAFSLVEQPIVACVHALALGGGLELALMSDLIVASEDAKMALPEVNAGLVPGLGGSQRLTKALGRYAGNYHIMTGEPIPISFALQSGLVQKVAKRSEVFQVALDLANLLASKPSTSLKLIKKCTQAAQDTNTMNGCGVETGFFAESMDQNAKKIGISAIFEKRKPDFSEV